MNGKIVVSKLQILLAMNNNISIQDRTKLFGIRIIKASQWLIEQGGASKILANQIIRCEALELIVMRRYLHSLKKTLLINTL